MPTLKPYSSGFREMLRNLFGASGDHAVSKFDEIRDRINDASDEEHTHEDDAEGGKLAHNDALKELDGGDADEYYHLKESEHTTVTDDVPLNTTHRSSDGKNHSDVVLNNSHRASSGSAHSHVALNTTHRTSVGTDHTYIDQDLRTTADVTHNNLEIDGALNHDGSTAGFFGTVPATKPSAYTPTNVNADRAYDADSTDVAELADVLGTLIADLQSLGLIG